jgi:predicted Zn-dependent protease
MLLSGCATFRVSDGVENLAAATGNQTVIKATSDLTPKQEHYLGRSIAATVLTRSPPFNSRRLQNYLNELGQYLALHSSRPDTFRGYRFLATKSDTAFALSAPGGFVFISDSLLRLMRTEDELASVFAHEIAHVALRHAEENIQTANRLKLGEQVLGVIATLDPTPSLLQAFGQAVSDSVNMKFNQGQELDADREGVAILERAGYASPALIRVIRRIPENSQASSTHPASTERLDNLDRLFRKYRYRQNKRTQRRFLRQMQQAGLTGRPM